MQRHSNLVQGQFEFSFWFRVFAFKILNNFYPINVEKGEVSKWHLTFVNLKKVDDTPNQLGYRSSRCSIEELEREEGLERKKRILERDNAIVRIVINISRPHRSLRKKSQTRFFPFTLLKRSFFTFEPSSLILLIVQFSMNRSPFYTEVL